MYPNKIFIFFILNMLLYDFSCAQKNHEIKEHYIVKDSLISNLNCKVFFLNTDNNDDSKIGFIETEDDLTISVTSMLISGNYVYLTDEYHKNIKRLNITTSEIDISKRFTISNKFKQFNDIVEFNGYLYISSSSNIVYIVSKDLNGINFINLPTLDIYPTYIKSISDSTLEFFVQFCDTAYVIDRYNNIIGRTKLSKSETIRFIDYFDLSKGFVRYKEMNCNSNFKNEFIINKVTVKLATPFLYSPESYNVDFNNDYLSIFNIERDKLTLYLYKLKNE